MAGENEGGPAVEECYGGEAGVQSASGEGTHDALEGLVVQDIF